MFRSVAPRHAVGPTTMIVVGPNFWLPVAGYWWRCWLRTRF